MSNGLKNGTWVWLVLLCGFALVAPCQAAEALKSLKLMPLWSPQAQFAGYYVALEKGIYARHGIDLKILRAGPGVSQIDALKKGEADFAVLWLASAMQHHAHGLDLVNLAQIIQKSSLVLVCRKSSGIRSVADLNGKKVGLWEGDVSLPLKALFRRKGITVQEIRQSGTVNLFLRGGIDAASAMWYNEYHIILDAGLNPDELTLIFPGKEGINFPEDGLYALRARANQDPALTEAFVQASIEGWRYAFAHPDEALDIVVRYMKDAKLPANRVHQKWMLERMRDLTLPDDSRRFGRLSPQDYGAMRDNLGRYDAIRDLPRFDAFVWKSDAEKK